MAFPFGGHPPLERFLEWAKEAGCNWDIKIRHHTQSGRPYESLEIVGPKGGRVALVNPDLGEHLAPSMITYLQRRLGVRSPFPQVPEQSGSSDVEFVPDDGSD